MTSRKLSTLLLGAMVFAGSGLATADTNPKKTPPKPAPQIIQPTPPSRSSKSHGSQYHPHQAKGSSKNSKRPLHGHS